MSLYAPIIHGCALPAAVQRQRYFRFGDRGVELGIAGGSGGHERHVQVMPPSLGPASVSPSTPVPLAPPAPSFAPGPGTPMGRSHRMIYRYPAGDYYPQYLYQEAVNEFVPTKKYFRSGRPGLGTSPVFRQRHRQGAGTEWRQGIPGSIYELVEGYSPYDAAYTPERDPYRQYTDDSWAWGDEGHPDEALPDDQLVEELQLVQLNSESTPPATQQNSTILQRSELRGRLAPVTRGRGLGPPRPQTPPSRSPTSVPRARPKTAPAGMGKRVGWDDTDDNVVPDSAIAPAPVIMSEEPLDQPVPLSPSDDITSTPSRRFQPRKPASLRLKRQNLSQTPSSSRPPLQDTNSMAPQRPLLQAASSMVPRRPCLEASNSTTPSLLETANSRLPTYSGSPPQPAVASTFHPAPSALHRSQPKPKSPHRSPVTDSFPGYASGTVESRSGDGAAINSPTQISDTVRRLLSQSLVQASRNLSDDTTSIRQIFKRPTKAEQVPENPQPKYKQSSVQQIYKKGSFPRWNVSSEDLGQTFSGMENENAGRDDRWRPSGPLHNGGSEARVTRCATPAPATPAGATEATSPERWQSSRTQVNNPKVRSGSGSGSAGPEKNTEDTMDDFLSPLLQRREQHLRKIFQDMQDLETLEK